MKRLILFAMLFLTLISVSFGASLRLDSMSTTPSSINPGDEVDITLRVQNVVSQNEDPKYSYTLELLPMDTLSENNIVIVDGEENLGRLGANEYWNAKFKIKVNEGAPSSDYELKVKIRKYLEGSLSSVTDTSITISVSGDTFFILDSEDKTISQGDVKKFNAVIKNVGGSNAGNVRMTFSNTEYLQILGTNSFYFDNIGNDDEENFELTLYAKDNIPTGTYTIPVTVEYNDGTLTRTQTLEAGVLVGGDADLKVANIQTTPKEIRPGDNYVLVSFDLQNIGDDVAKSITAHLISEEFESSYSDNNLQTIGRVDSGASSNLKFYIDIPKETQSGVYDLKLNVDYKNNLEEDFNKTLTVPLFVKEKPQLEVKTISSSGKAGNTIEVRVEVENTGEEKATEVDMRLISDSSLPFSIEERSVYLGTIDTNETKTAVFNVKVSSDAQIKDYSVRSFLRARGDSEIGDNNIYTFNKDVTIDVTGKAINKLALAGIIVAILVVLGIIFRKKVSSKKSKK